MKQQLVTIVLGEVAQAVRGEIFQPPLIKSAPVYAASAVPRPVMIGQETGLIDDRRVVFNLRGYPPDILLIQATLDVENIFQKEIIALEEKVFRSARLILQSYGGNQVFSEEYSIFIISGYQGEPEQFLVHAPVIASLLKSERLDLDPNEVEYTLKSQIKYANNDLTIIDWDGAWLFDPEGDTEEDLELLTLANLQLLRHRILDRQLDERLELLANRANKTSTGMWLAKNKDITEDLREIIKNRMASISELQRLERDIKLIGDWYSARFYDLATSKFKLEEWRKSIRSKLESLEDIYSIVVENFTVSAKHRAEWIQIIAFFFLQIGWFILIFLEIFHLTR
ncbi:MAG: hypothetical protein WC975_07840 [Phycisphaerae bacterium]